MYLSSWPNKCYGANDDIVNITWCWCWCQWHHMTKNSWCTSFQLSWLNKSNGTIDSDVEITWCLLTHVPMVSHDQKSHATSHFDLLGLTNAMVQFTVPSASQDTNASVTWPKKSCCTCLNFLHITNAMVPLMMIVLSHVDTSDNGVTWPR